MVSFSVIFLKSQIEALIKSEFFFLFLSKINPQKRLKEMNTREEGIFERLNALLTLGFQGKKKRREK